MGARGRWVLVAVGLALAAGCGGSDDSDDGPTGTAESTGSTTSTEGAPASSVEFTEELCDILGEDDLAFIGPLFSSLAEQDDPSKPHVVCTYTFSLQPSVSVQLFLDGGDAANVDRADSMLEDNPDYEAVDDVGAAAVRMQPEVGTLIVWTDNGVRFSLIGPDVPARDDVFAELADVVVSRLEAG